MDDRNEGPAVSRRTIIVAAVGAAPALALGASGAKAGQLSQAAARYRPTPDDDEKCANCNLFMAPGACKIVSGAISPNGWCTLWVKKA
ncbi:MAG: high-potential iron-sulfur protein [Hyphomicrobiales bacterium]|nr:high-potential iron-sulfur protein [Hyphomicrobiales bacterium]MDE2018053.1 high-potential iron-sulfur protein [Hyphomicrobiales bacterium]